mmetsp:Transcript_112437/g.157658  ORF Transcript_112437/g.157658 Transcript_112437/m.157658 type:complete len:130 (-) Transcript_112437:175-564(-)|eukprot:symbB.v1.2.003979.t1/scaffold170.1/size288889/25
MESQGTVDVSMSQVTPEMTGLEQAAEDLEIRRSRSAILPTGPPEVEHSRSAMWFLADEDQALEPCQRSRTALVCLSNSAEGASDGEAVSSGHFREEIVMADGGVPQRKSRPSRTALWIEDPMSMPESES